MFKLSPSDIVQQNFERSFRGYDREQVDEFLRAIAREWKQMRAELERVRSEAEDRASELEEYREREQKLCDALETAKSAADDIREEAEREAEATIQEAEIEADRILAEVEHEVEQLQEDIARLRHQRRQYRAQLRALLESHLEVVEGMEDVPREEGISRSPSIGSEPVDDGATHSEDAVAENGEASGGDSGSDRPSSDSRTANGP